MHKKNSLKVALKILMQLSCTAFLFCSSFISSFIWLILKFTVVLWPTYHDMLSKFPIGIQIRIVSA